MGILSIIGIIIGIIVLILIVSVVTIQFDLVSYTATGTESVSPSGTPVGNALVVYSPGVTGAGKKAAAGIADDLKDKGYNVTVAGVRNSAATSTSNYNVIIVGGPMYFGKVSNSVDSYLKTLNVPENANIGVFGTTGWNDESQEDRDTLQAQVSSILGSKNFTIKTIRSSDTNAAQDYQSLVSSLIG